jgi:hypothetical protein
MPTHRLARPPKPLNRATISGMEVICTIRAAAAPISAADDEAGEDPPVVDDTLVERVPRVPPAACRQPEGVARRAVAARPEKLQTKNEQRRRDDVAELDPIWGASTISPPSS